MGKLGSTFACARHEGEKTSRGSIGRRKGEEDSEGCGAWGMESRIFRKEEGKRMVTGGGGCKNKPFETGKAALIVNLHSYHIEHWQIVRLGAEEGCLDGDDLLTTSLCYL